ncbi:MAG TPA: molybdopterin-dependent oxidoreductase [Polyangiaceae bacterium]|jgi:anaerobic selenocysteine-containing dehydrogenase|nr:MAG: Assimilatory nitrate reductase catalytic subunit [Deltaproteobacteria bacterium ADurb.Bin207]HNT00055.1 molybdopterin-dependent oxidoreductase [Polyangiaceae bacterium]HNZ24725.1 molybdopterin-dependent oxidoreductase [Polyangiaceae bacterium]HOD24628.1 molybdopterin-dependent oxidoreductase [Polyangiaceae bacterium]HOE50717.1 molybdopterin-dependent oxidoreductase [Polyangiaceae bacterium]
MRVKTLCLRDCPDSCGLVATVEQGQLLRVDGDPDHPITKGTICARTRRFPHHPSQSERLLFPLIRTNCGFRQASWEEAIGSVADTLLAIRAQSGPEAILHARFSGSMGVLAGMVDAFFSWFGPVTTLRGSVCNDAGKVAQEMDFGISDGHDVTDLDHSRHALLWGKNPFVSHLHLVPWLQNVRKRGGQVVLIDPVYHASARLADRVIQPRPGSDAFLACAVARKILDDGRAVDLGSMADNAESYEALLRSRPMEIWARQADVNDKDIAYLADLGMQRPCAFLLGWGMARRSQGGAIVRAIDALCALSGNVGIAGGGASYRIDGRGVFSGVKIPRASRTIPEPQFARAILEATSPAIRAVWITSGNPVVMLPHAKKVEQALRTRECCVVVDSFLTDTTECATIVLPTTTMFEKEDMVHAYGHGWLRASVRAVEPPAGVLSDLEIVQRLARAIDERSGGETNLAARLEGTARQWKERMATPLLETGIDMDEVERKAVRNPFAPRVPFDGGVFPTTGGRMHLITEVPEEAQADPAHPLWLMSSSVRDAQGSQWSIDLPDVWPATCHPDAAPGWEDGDVVTLCNEQATMQVQLRFDERQRRDVMLVAKGGPLSKGQCANALVFDTKTDLGEGAALLDAKVRIT